MQYAPVRRFGRNASMRLISLWIVAITVAMTQPCNAGNQVLYVDADAPPGGNGQSWATALKDLSLARGIVDPGGGGATVYSQVWVAEGAYRPSIIFFGDPRY